MTNHYHRMVTWSLKEDRALRQVAQDTEIWNNCARHPTAPWRTQAVLINEHITADQLTPSNIRFLIAIRNLEARNCSCCLHAKMLRVRQSRPVGWTIRMILASPSNFIHLRLNFWIKHIRRIEKCKNMRWSGNENRNASFLEDKWTDRNKSFLGFSGNLIVSIFGKAEGVGESNSFNNHYSSLLE